MVIQYPHTATVDFVGPTTTLTNGDLQPGEKTTVSFKCRIEALENSSGKGYVDGADGVKIDFTWVVYSEIGEALPVGAAITVKNADDSTVCKDTIKQCYVGQFNRKLWL